MFEAGASTAEVEAWLEEQAGMAEVEADDTALRFRLEGGRGTWILRTGAFDTRGSFGAVSSATRPVRQPVAGQFHVVGGKIEQKKALVLSPMLWHFDVSDDGQEVASILAGTRGYENGVTYLANDSKTSSVVGVDRFKGWEDYQVVHVVSHGFRLCKEAPCRAVIAASTLQGAFPDEPGVIVKTARIPSLTDRGLELAKVEGNRIQFVLLTADFFRFQYSGGLDDTLVFFNACETFGSQATDLADAIRGSTSVFLGWDKKVFSGDAYSAAVSLYKELSERGSQVETAYTNLGALQTDRAGAYLVRGERREGGDLRIRDVVYLLDPGSDRVLSSSDQIAIEGTPGDDEPDAVPYLVQVDGIPKEFASKALVHVSVDGMEADPQPLSNGEGNEQDQWTISGVVPLGYDLEEDKTVNFRAWVELPSGGESEHKTPATVIGEAPIMGLVWELEATSVIGLGSLGRSQTSTAHLTLEFAEGQYVDEPHPRYVVTGGTVTYAAQEYVDAISCAWSAPQVTYEATADMIPAVTSSFLEFDTTVTPVEYWGVIWIQGHEVTAEVTCPQDSQTSVHAGNFPWLVADGGEHRTVTDRSMIAGSRHVGADGFTNLDWTVTRTK
jgi:hypothetical protein